MDNKEKNVKTLNILITAGGTSEPIDNVRRITNSGTGRLGALIAETFAANRRCRIIYICSSGAVRPQHTPAVFDGGHVVGTSVLDMRIADDVLAVKDAVLRACSEMAFDIVIHSMAISDYMVRAVSDASLMARVASERLSTSVPADLSLRENKIREAILSPPSIRESKISSNRENLVVVLEKAPKVIALYRGLARGALIVGFKLLSDVNEAALVHAGLGLLKKNDCDFVFANDMSTVRGDCHEGLLIARDGTYDRASGKESIAALIVKRTVDELK